MEKLEEYEYREKPTSVKFNLLVRLVNKITSAIEDALSRIGLLDANKADKTNVYTKSEVNSALDTKADKATTYTKTEVDAKLVQKADKADVYTKSEVNSALNSKADKSDTYTKSELFNKDQCSHFEFGVISMGIGYPFYWHGQTVWYNGFSSCDYQVGYGESGFELWICFIHTFGDHYRALRCKYIDGSYNKFEPIEEVNDQERIDKWFGRTIATQEEKGLMSAEDKKKLDNIPESFATKERKIIIGRQAKIQAIGNKYLVSSQTQESGKTDIKGGIFHHFGDSRDSIPLQYTFLHSDDSTITGETTLNELSSLVPTFGRFALFEILAYDVHLNNGAVRSHSCTIRISKGVTDVPLEQSSSPFLYVANGVIRTTAKVCDLNKNNKYWQIRRKELRHSFAYFLNQGLHPSGEDRPMNLFYKTKKAIRKNDLNRFFGVVAARFVVQRMFRGRYKGETKMGVLLNITAQNVTTKIKWE